MPRKKQVDPVVLMLDFYSTEPLPALEVVHRILTRELQRRRPQETKPAPVRRRRQKVGSHTPQPAGTSAGTFAGETPATEPSAPAVAAEAPAPKRRRRRQAAPASDAPIVPQVSEVGEGNDEAYTGE